MEEKNNKKNNYPGDIMDSLICWIGGKKQLRKIIAKYIPKNITAYIEPFGGAGWVLFYRDKWADFEIYNDKDERLVNLFKIAKYHPKALHEEMTLLLHSRQVFQELKKWEGFTDIQRAARFFYLLKHSFGAKTEHFGTSAKCNSAKSYSNILISIEEVTKRLNRVTIENLDYKNIFKIYDNENNFFFIDPPYRHGVQYKTGRLDFDELYSELKKLKGKFLLTVDDCKENRKLFREYKIRKVSRINGINRMQIKNNRFKELIITNY